jgi:hypothetical protein
MENQGRGVQLECATHRLTTEVSKWFRPVLVKLDCPATGDEIDYQHNQRYDQQQMDQ